MPHAQNIKMEVQGNELVIRVDLNKSFGPSTSGKSIIVASTGGNVAVPGRDQVKVGVNVYRPARG
ncbi:hypothetical protein KSC_046140 [Ktedonobacter sp. SOSP1-52]|uniref:hypothetical protein n=1 Tax=Ktedonobacter sp. SOSP1-52 TaxID=2778366 RepID=UPI0019153BCF|nr:hypothetical protein [Ktedonobacter sp. SOSP1-52]GHO65722.1 hypothetical protein KSC_046140 [Ktedonobacter sp. SOSP1-52]